MNNMALCDVLLEISNNVLLCGNNSGLDYLEFQWCYSYVFLSIFICIIYSAIACDMYAKTALAGKTFHIAILKTGSIYGLGIFSMHFVGMYALIYPGPFLYDFYITAFSLWLAVSGTSLTLLLLYQKHSLILAAFVFGLTICAMHYSGMLSVLANPYHMHHQIELLLLAVIYAILGSYFALSEFQKYTHDHNKKTLFASSSIMGLTIAGMHYLAMSAMEFSPELLPTKFPHPAFISRDIIIWFTVLLLLITIFIYIIDSINSEQKLTLNKYELELSNKSISSSLSKLKSMQNQLIESEKMASLGQLISGVSHEINTPIGICVTSASYLEELSSHFFQQFHDNQLARKDFEEYEKSHQSSTQLINENLRKASELIAIFKQVSVDQDLDSPRRFYLGKFIQELLSSFSHKTKDKSIEMTQTGDHDFEVNTYAGALIVILTHLINNSLLHGFSQVSEGRINIHISLKDDQVILEYSDNGCGMNSEDNQKVFSPFFTTKRSAGFCGLGMNIVYNQTTQKLLGSLTCKSEPKQGVHINISFPQTIEMG
jgi:NO-binding membrane sensor protein with MHYT domain